MTKNNTVGTPHSQYLLAIAIPHHSAVDDLEYCGYPSQPVLASHCYYSPQCSGLTVIVDVVQDAQIVIIIIIIIEGLSLLQSIPPTTADKQTQAQKRRGSRAPPSRQDAQIVIVL